MSPSGTEHTFTVADFTALLRETLTVTFPRDVWVQGEVRNMKRAASGHVYFDLVDASDDPGRPPDAVLSVVLMRSTRQIVNRQVKAAGGGIRIDDGVQLRVRGAPDFYPPQGRLQLRMTGIDPTYTLGQLTAARDQLLRLLHEEGVLDANRQRHLPVAPLTVGLVTSAGSAAAADFLDELDASGIGFRVVLAATRVQGDLAPRGVAAAIERCGRAGVDVIAVVRGGGARTDLVAFDHELVARAIAGSPVPVFTGVGHEIDESVADAVAHQALKTPTACAAYIVERVAAAELDAETRWAAIAERASGELLTAERELRAAAMQVRTAATDGLRNADAHTVASAQRARHVVTRQVGRQRERVDRAAGALGLVARHRTEQADHVLADAERRLHTRSRQHVVAAERQIEALAERHRLLDPARALARGWSITTTADGTLVRSTDAVAPGTELRTRVADGHITSTVDDAAKAGDR